VSINAISIDLRGHGENRNYYSIDVLNDLNTLIAQLNSKSKTIAIGHSLGGRLAMISDANYKIGISPAFLRNYSEQTVAMINNFRKYRVKEQSDNINFEILKNLPVFDNESRNTMIVYGSRDVPEIKEECIRLSTLGIKTKEIKNAFHNDIYTVNETFVCIGEFINSIL
jgi:hypothetical protein